MDNIKHLKTILAFLLAFALIATPALAAGQGLGNNADHNNRSHIAPGQSDKVNFKLSAKTADDDIKIQIQAKNKTEDQTRDQTQNKTNASNGQPEQVKVRYTEKTDSGETVKVQIHTRQGAHNATSLRIMVREKERVLNASGYKSQNTVHLAVNTFLAAGNLTGNAGPQMIRIAERFNSSANITAQAEERIQIRNTFSRFLFGGDSDAAGEIQRQVIENQVRIQEMNQLMQDCECDPEVQAILMEQMQHMEQEQTRLQILAEQEQNDRGLLGGLFG